MRKKSLFIILIFIAFLAMKTPSAVLAQTTISPSDIDKSRSLTILNPNETVISDYREKDDGMFSNMWAVYILSEGEGEKKDWFIELNGKKIGPFENNSDLISFSPNGKQVVFAAKEKKANKWSVYVNGVKRWSFDGLAWGTYTWPLGLKGNTIRSQSKAVVFVQSDDDKFVSFLSSREEGDKTLWANVTNGKEGRYYQNVSTDINFINSKVAYWAWKSDNAKYFVVGNEEYGPYDEAYSIKFSDNKKHFAFIAKSKGKNILVLDGKENIMPGEIETHALGNDGNYTVAYTQKGSVHVIQNGATWPKNYSETVWHQFRMTPDGKTLAGWFKQDGKWYVVVNGKTEYGPYESYYYIKAGEIFSLFLGRTGENVAYFTRLIEGNSTGMEFYLNGKKIENAPSFGGFAMTVYQDDSGSIVGTGLMGGVEADIVAIADAASVGADNPLKAKYFGSHLVYTKKKGELTYVVVDNKEFGPFVDAGSFCSSPSGNHYGYIAENQNGKWVVVDGKYQSSYYDSVYKLQFTAENEIAFLTIKNGKVVRIFSKIK
ncbi:MAG: hypothetical protein HY761_10555 [Candidatus Omnitrophica bacterium]|nr:hypothetical protein [Candidatus Omnitrophota bacterium]